MPYQLMHSIDVGRPSRGSSWSDHRPRLNLLYQFFTQVVYVTTRKKKIWPYAHEIVFHQTMQNMFEGYYKEQVVSESCMTQQAQEIDTAVPMYAGEIL
ncbi:hypothetical protein J6590_075424 [Homalodisca vitripennis]|nr:hypothetical protein J6590_075424 [Homalodisca vitripennis]